ncbi:glycosyltransferase [Halioxenophilus aromaticivorans]
MEFKSNSNERQPEQLESIEDHRNKSNYLFHLLNESYGKVYKFDKSVLGKVVFALEFLYSLVTFRVGRKSEFRQLVELSKKHKEIYKLDYSSVDSDLKRGRLNSSVQVLRYFASHPISSLRLISWYRVKRLALALFTQDKTSLKQWVDARFPEERQSFVVPELISKAEIDGIALIDFPDVDQPLVSIVVPVYNNYKTTLSCLLALKKNTDLSQVEIIIGDDCSTDETISLANITKNVVICRQRENVGFVENCNRAAKVARGEFLLLLNNDTNVQAGWLEALLATFDSDKSVGMAGPMFLFEDGSLQEAGGIVWKDASAWNYGRSCDPNEPEFLYVREADYISGACLMLKLELWNDLCGFDERYRPAYYEDTDLAFKVREYGLKVVYQPLSKVVHFEGLSNGTDVGSGLKKYQEINKDVFYEKWKNTLATKHFANGQSVFDAKDRKTANKKATVLIIDHYVPFWDKDAGSRSTFLYIEEMLRLGMCVKFIGANFFPHQPYTQLLQNMGVEVLYGEKCARGWKQWVRSQINNIDVIYLHRPHITEVFIDFLLELPKRPKLIYFGHDLHFLRTQREAKLKSDQKLFAKAEDWKKRELAICSKVDQVFYPSNVEVDLIKEMLPEVNVDTIPLYMIEQDDIALSQVNREKIILFVGGFGHPPNMDGIKWFIDEVFPLVLKEDNSVKLHLVGSEAPETLLKLDCQNIRVHGYLVEDQLLDLYRRAMVSIVPLRFGAGVKGKVLEALKMNLPVVTTTVGAEGLPEASSVFAVTDDFQEFANLVLQRVSDSKRCIEIVKRYENYINSYFSRARVTRVIEDKFFVNQTNSTTRNRNQKTNCQ